MTRTNSHVDLTYFGVGAPSGPGQLGQPALGDQCPQCKGELDGAAFCPRDGTVIRSFSIADRYLVDRLLGRGSSALVFGGTHRSLGRPVAIKLLRPTVAASAISRERFLREARAASALRHENIVEVIDHGEDTETGLPFLVMEKLVGESLATVVSRVRQMPWRRCVAIMMQLCRALAVAHGRGVVHRDVKPANIFLEQVSQREVVKLCDFGLVRSVEDDQRLTVNGEFIGSPAYVAPEQIRGDADLDGRADLYSLAATAYELLSGVLPIQAENSVALLAAKLTQPATPLSSQPGASAIPPALAALIMSALDPQPSQRPACAEAFERELIEILTAEPMLEPMTPERLLGQFAGSYQLKSVLGVGGSAVVFRAEHPMIGTAAAVKILMPEVAALPGMSERFISEARASSQIGSPHIAKFFDFGTLPSRLPFAVMELLVGETLTARLHRKGRFSVEDVQAVVLQVAQALSLAHAANIIHRDIKPDNLFCNANPSGAIEMKVLDFGVAHFVASDRAKLTQQGGIVGTPRYAPPEQLLAAEVTARADVYALGATAFELLTGAPAFPGEVTDIIVAKTTKAPPDLRSFLPAIHPEIAATIGAMLAPQPDERPPMAEVVARVLAWPVPTTPAPSVVVPQLAAGHSGLLASSTSNPSATGPAVHAGHAQRHRAWLAIAAVVLLGASVLVWRAFATRQHAAIPSVGTPTVAPSALAPTDEPVVTPIEPTPTVPSATPPSTQAPIVSAQPNEPITTPTRKPAAGTGKPAALPSKPAAAPSKSAKPPGKASDMLIVDPYQ